MVRSLSILLLLLLGLPSALPMFGSAVRDGDVPSCCRRAGAHQCAMTAMERARLFSPEREWRAVPEPCPFRTQLRSATTAGTLFAAGGRVSVVPPPALAGIVAQASAARRVARERIRQKRGPPFFFS